MLLTVRNEDDLVLITSKTVGSNELTVSVDVDQYLDIEVELLDGRVARFMVHLTDGSELHADILDRDAYDNLVR